MGDLSKWNGSINSKQAVKRTVTLFNSYLQKEIKWLKDHKIDIRARLHQASVPTQIQRCDDACGFDLFERLESSKMGCNPILEQLYLLPPTSEEWGKVLFSVCLSVHISGGEGVPQSGRGVPHPRSGWGVPIPGLAGGGTPPQIWPWRVPYPRSGQGGTPFQVWLGGGYPRSGPGYPPIPRTWYVAPPDLGFCTPPDLGWGNPPDLGCDTPWTWDWVPSWTWDGVPPRPGMVNHPPPLDLGQGTPRTWDGVPPRQISIASSCYTAGGMPLAFTQEDFLVSIDFNESYICG